MPRFPLSAYKATKVFNAIVRIHSQVEIEYYRNGGILQFVLRDMLQDGNRG